MARLNCDTPDFDEAGAPSPKAEALRELAELASGAENGEMAVLTKAAKRFMGLEAERLWRRFHAECRRARGPLPREAGEAVGRGLREPEGDGEDDVMKKNEALQRPTRACRPRKVARQGGAE